MSEDNKDLQEANPFVTGASKILSKIRGGKTMEVIPPKGPSVSMPRGVSGTEISTASKTGSGLKPVGIGTAAVGAAAVGAGTYAYQQAKKDAAETPAGRTGAGINKVMNRGETPTPPKTPEPIKTATVEPKTFSQAFSAARKTAAEKGSPSTGKFEFKGKEYQTNIKGEKYVPTATQTAVNTEKQVPTPPSRPADLKPEPASSTPKTDDAAKVTTPKTESGGKKKMSEENNKLIDMFLRLQEKNTLTPNIFEAAKKAKKDYDGDGKVESPKDEVWGSRFAAAKAAGKMEESEQLDEIGDTARGQKKLARVYKRAVDRTMTATEPFFKHGKMSDSDKETVKKLRDVKDRAWERMAEGAGEETAKKETSMSVTMDNKPSTPAQTTAATSGPSDADKKALDTKIKSIAKEEVEFSQAEIDHINSFFEAVAPSRAEPTKGVNPTVRNTDLTDETLEEGRPRKNPTPETTERDARQHIQVQAGRASGGTVVDFKHDNGKISKLTPGMGRAITAHLNGLKPAERQEAVKRMHASPEGLKV